MGAPCRTEEPPAQSAFQPIHYAILAAQKENEHCTYPSSGATAYPRAVGRASQTNMRGWSRCLTTFLSIRARSPGKHDGTSEDFGSGATPMRLRTFPVWQRRDWKVSAHCFSQPHSAGMISWRQMRRYLREEHRSRAPGSRKIRLPALLVLESFPTGGAVFGHDQSNRPTRSDGF